jgi:hypothetical protein
MVSFAMEDCRERNCNQGKQGQGAASVTRLKNSETIWVDLRGVSKYKMTRHFDWLKKDDRSEKLKQQCRCDSHVCRQTRKGHGVMGCQVPALLNSN